MRRRVITSRYCTWFLRDLQRTLTLVSIYADGWAWLVAGYRTCMVSLWKLGDIYRPMNDPMTSVNWGYKDLDHSLQGHVRLNILCFWTAHNVDRHDGAPPAHRDSESFPLTINHCCSCRHYDVDGLCCHGSKPTRVLASHWYPSKCYPAADLLPTTVPTPSKFNVPSPVHNQTVQTSNPPIFLFFCNSSGTHLNCGFRQNIHWEERLLQNESIVVGPTP